MFQRIRELYATLLYEYLQNHHRISQSLDGTLMQLMQYLLEQFVSRESGKGGLDDKTAFIIRYMDMHWNEELTLSSLAKEVHFSVSYLSRFFQKTTGLNFSSYLRKVHDMHIYSEDADGNPVFSFFWMDQLFDFVTELGLTPFIELGFMPEKLAKEQTQIFDRSSVISGCSKIERWKQLIQAVLQHLAERYGIEKVRTWRFATVSLSYVRVGCLTLEDYEELYETTYRTVKAFDAGLVFGGSGCFADLTDDEEIGLPWFLQFASAHGCLPDFHSIQWYPCVQTDDSLFLEYTLNQRSAPALLSTDPDYLQKKLDELEETFRNYHVEDRELFLEECSPTLWQRDLSCDTCYKAVWLAKNMSISAGRAVFGYWLLTDFLEERAQIQSVFHGGYGLFTYNGIPKAGYQAMRMISMLGSELVAKGDGYVLTQSKEQGSLQLQFRLRDLEPGRYRITRTTLTRGHGSAFDQWLRLQAPPYLTREETVWLQQNCEPEHSMDVTECAGTLSLEVTRMPLEMELIVIESGFSCKKL